MALRSHFHEIADPAVENETNTYEGLDLPILEARVDWITCTAGTHSAATDLYAIGSANAAAEIEVGHKGENWRFQSFIGQRAGRWRFGTGPLGAIVVVSGDQAQLGARWLAETAEHFSRVDYCVTVLDTEGKLDPSNHYWDAWQTLPIPSFRRPKLRRVQEWQGGSTVMIGARESAYYLRVYDKHAESPREYPEGAWRWECEMKRQASEQQQKVLKSLSSPSSHVLNLISTEISRLSLSVPWRKGSIVEHTSLIRYEPDCDRTLGWLASQVRPSVQFAAAARGEDAVLAALDLKR